MDRRPKNTTSAHAAAIVLSFPVLLGARLQRSKLMNKQIITVSPEIMGGTPVFAGTRVPVQTFLEYIKAGESIDSFLEGFPSVKREQLIALLDQHS